MNHGRKKRRRLRRRSQVQGAAHGLCICAPMVSEPCWLFFFLSKLPFGEFPGFLVWSKLIVVLLYRSIPLTTSAAFQCYPGQGPALNMRTASSSTNFTPFRSEICHPNLSIDISFHRLPLCQLALLESRMGTQVIGCYSVFISLENQKGGIGKKSVVTFWQSRQIDN